MEGTAVSADGVSIAFAARGAGAPTLVFVHGWSCDRGYWRFQLGPLADHHHVVAIDLAGHGDSGRTRAEWTMPAFGEDVVAIVDQLGLDRAVLVGHSMGGDVIVEAARRLPAVVIGLVWVDTYRTLGESSSRRDVENFLAPFRQNFVPATRGYVRTLFAPDSDPDLVEAVADDMAAAPREIALSALEHAITFEPAIRAGLRKIGVPVVAINPDYKPTDVEALRRHGVKAVIMSGVGHFLMMEDPETFNRLLAETVKDFDSSPLE